MKYIRTLLLLAIPHFFAATVPPDEKGHVTKSMYHPDYVWKRIHIKWGIVSKSRQIWDGHARIDSGHVLKVVPFIRRDLLDDAKLVTATSWKSETHTDVEGIFLTVYGPPEARVDVTTKTHPFSFTIKALETSQKLTYLDGDIEVEDQTEDLLFRIQGLEYGKTGSGTASISPSHAYTDSLGTWRLTYQADDGIPAGGGIRVSWHFTRSWGKPQFTEPRAPNYVTVTTNGAARLDYQSEHRGLFEYPFTQGRILVRVLDKPLEPGETISVVLGDTSMGSPGFQTPVIAEDGFAFRVESCTELPPNDFPIYRRLQVLPTLDILSNQAPVRLFIVAPSTTNPSESFALKLSSEDPHRNITPHAGSLVTLTAHSGSTVHPLGTHALAAEDSGRWTIANLRLPSEGTWRIVADGSGSLRGASNPIRCSTEADYQLYWGELHGHTQYSDGYGSAESYFTFARENAALDFAAITDHDTELDAPDYTVDEMWREVNRSVAEQNDPGSFVSVLAYEWSPARITETTKYPYGDKNVLYFQKQGYLFPTGDTSSNTAQKLFQRLRELPIETLVKVIPHVGGAIGNWEIHDPDLEPLGEIYSVHGSFEQFGQIALDKGYRIGFVGAADAHNGRIGGFPPGNSANHFVHGGLTGVYARSLTRESLYDAVASRRVFATTGERTILEFSIDGQPMGADIKAAGPPEIRAFAAGESPIWKVELIKNGKVIHRRFNVVADSTVLTVLWRNQVERSDLLDFDSGFWSRRLRAISWRGSISAAAGGLHLLAPCSFDYPKDAMLGSSADSLSWYSESRGDYDGVQFRVADPLAPLSLTVKTAPFGTVATARGFVQRGADDAARHAFSIIPAELPKVGREIALSPTDRVTLIRGLPSSSPVTFNFTDNGLLLHDNYYYLRVTHINGEMAWSSPIWIASKSE